VGADRGELEGERARRVELQVVADGEVAGAIALGHDDPQYTSFEWFGLDLVDGEVLGAPPAPDQLG
jgi:hypothetical protein